jgi:hypothetical protein
VKNQKTMPITDIVAILQSLDQQTKSKSQKEKNPKHSTPAHRISVTDELLEITANRIVSALNLQAKGVTAADLIAQVKAYEQSSEGLVQ